MGSVIPFPEEVLFLIVKATSEDFRNNDDGPSIRSSNEQLLPISRVNRMMRRICLPIIYECINIRLTRDTFPPGAASLDTFRRVIGNNPALASLVRRINIQGFHPGYSDFSFLRRFPNLVSIEFPQDIRLDVGLLDLINGHPSLCIARFQSEECLSLPTLLPPGSLSRVQVIDGELSGDSDIEGEFWKYLTMYDLKVEHMRFRGLLNPRYFEITYPDLRYLELHIHPISEERPTWYSRFIERHPRLERVCLDFEPLVGMERPQIWALQRRFFPHLQLLCDTVVDRRLILSFDLNYAIAERGFLPVTIPVARLPIVQIVVKVDPAATTDVIRCIGASFPALEKLQLKFYIVDSPIVDVGDFASILGEQFLKLSSLTLVGSLELSAIICDGAEISHLIGCAEDKRQLRVERYWKEMVRLVLLFASVIPTLECVTFRSSKFLDFTIVRPEDGQGTIRVMFSCYTYNF